MITNTAVLDQVQAYVDLVQANYNGRGYSNGDTFFLENTGQKYNRIVHARSDGSQRSVHAFVDNDGLLYKSAGWKAPVKDARWDLMDPANFEALSLVVSWSGGHLYVLNGVRQLRKGYTVANRPVVEVKATVPVSMIAHTARRSGRPAPKSRKSA